jgi:O-antigen/teichoic acid export membrane protein
MPGAAEPSNRPPPEEPPVEPPALSPGVDETAPALEPYGNRFDLRGRGLRGHAARGVIVNSAFQVGLVGLGLVRNIGVAAFLTAAEFGFWGLIVTILLTLIWLKQVGIGDKYIQQDDPDQEAAFQKAFTLELGYSACFFVLFVLALPVYALIYDRTDIMLPGLLLAVIILTSALQTPVWIAYRQMRFVRQRLIESVDPVVSTVLVIGLAIAGYGYWSLVVGIVAGSLVGAVVAVASCPYPIRLRYERGTFRQYINFSWPLLAGSISALVAVQGTVIIGNYTIGLAGIGAIGLAGQVARFSDQVDAIVSRTIYPAVCAVKDRIEVLEETFIKSNRVALMWGVPFGLALALFAPDLITHVLGETWRPAEFLLQAFGVIFAVRQVAFNWTLFVYALGDTRPVAVEGVFVVIAFAFVTAPMLFIVGVDGYAAGAAATVLLQLGVRAHYLRRIFSGFGFFTHLLRAFAPSVAAVAAVLGMRAIADGDRSLEMVLAELAVYGVLTVVATFAFERRLLGEMVGYLKRAGGAGVDREPVAA